MTKSSNSGTESLPLKHKPVWKVFLLDLFTFNDYWAPFLLVLGVANAYVGIYIAETAEQGYTNGLFAGCFLTSFLHSQLSVKASDRLYRSMNGLIKEQNKYIGVLTHTLHQIEDELNVIITSDNGGDINNSPNHNNQKTT